MSKPNQIFQELRSEEVQEIMTRPPLWLLQWGITVVAGILLVLLAGTYIVHYPDLIRASFKLTPLNAPRVVLTRTDGKLIRLLVQDGQIVTVGTSLAYLESTAQHKQVLQLSQELGKAWTIASKGNLEGLDRLKVSNYGQLGELQTAYQTFEQNRIQLKAYLANGFFSRKKEILQQEIIDLQALAQNLREQQAIQAQDIQLAQEDYDIQRRLYDEKIIARQEIKREESKNIARKLPFQQTASAFISNLTAQRAKQKEILELEQQVAQERDQFLQALNSLRSATEAWKAKYVLTAPVSGRLFYPSILQENQSVTNNQELFYVAPPNSDYIGELYIQQASAGKVAVGQDILIKFAGFPYEEFGAVRGQITNIADIPLKDSVFLAKVSLPNGLTTTYGRSLVYKAGMTASADIITADNRLIEKLFYQLRKIANSQ